MRNLKQLVVKARQFKDSKFGDFVITDVDLDNNVAKADFGNGAVAEIDISNAVPSIVNYSKRNKKFYIRMV